MRLDKRYMADMVKDHKKDIQETAKIAKKAKDPEFKAAVERPSRRGGRRTGEVEPKPGLAYA